jgi:hypothetical protein
LIFENSKTLQLKIKELISDEILLKNQSEISENYVAQKIGATDAIYSHIKKYLR